jgi:hypothetical protein
MGGMNETATIYLLEDINDNRYIGSTSEKDYTRRLSTHKRDKKEDLFGVRKRNCSSMKLDLEHTAIIPLMVVENDTEVRKKWEAHYINNVYPECVNHIRFTGSKDTKKKYYEKNKEKCQKRSKEWKEKNKEKYNQWRREYYAKNKDKINARRRELSELKRLENI